MPGFTTVGSRTKTSFLHTEAHKTTQEFVAAAVIKRGQLLMMNAVGDVIIWTSASLRHLCIGVAYNDAAIGEFVTVWTRGYAIIWALSNAAVSCAVPVTVSSYDSTTPAPAGEMSGTLGFPKYANSATPEQTVGWALDDAAGADLLIRVLLMD